MTDWHDTQCCTSGPGYECGCDEECVCACPDCACGGGGSAALESAGLAMIEGVRLAMDRVADDILAMYPAD